jgi:hypothetical protein
MMHSTVLQVPALNELLTPLNLLTSCMRMNGLIALQTTRLIAPIRKRQSSPTIIKVSKIAMPFVNFALLSLELKHRQHRR